MILVFLSGPLSGLIVQPIVGDLADRSTSKFGRRRPFMVGGTLATILGALLLGFTREVASWLVAGPSEAVSHTGYILKKCQPCFNVLLPPLLCRMIA